MINVLFVCLGNICRSPMAEAVFKDLVINEGLDDRFHIDSVGTGDWHVGEKAHRGTRNVLSQHGIRCDSRSRQVTRTDLEQADYVIAMDLSNVSELDYSFGNVGLNGRVHLLLDFADNTRVREVPDPYYNGNFEGVYKLVDAGCRGLLAHIREEQKI